MMSDAENLPTISVVTPTLNQAAYLEQTLHSVHDQRYPKLEHIVVDGGSTDGTVAILERWNERLTWWVSEPDRGQTHALNKGFAHARGEVWAYLNSDDVYADNALWIAGRFFADHPEVDLLHGRCDILGEDGSVQRSHLARIQSHVDALDLWNIWFQQGQFVQPEVFWRAPAGDATFDESYNYAMDYDYWVRLLREGAAVAAIEQTLAGFRLTRTQKSRAAAAAAEELFAIVRRELWHKNATIPPRHRLRGEWIYSQVLLPAIAASVSDGESKVTRYLKVLVLCLKHPQLLLSRQLYRRTTHVIGIPSR